MSLRFDILIDPKVSSEAGILGDLYVNEALICHTLELPWKNNEKGAALELRAHDHAADADEILSRARSWLATRSPQESARRDHRIRTADVLFAMRRFDSAATLYADLVRERATNDTRGRLGSTAAMRGDTASAARMNEELKKPASKYDSGLNTYWRAAIAATSGNKELAVTLLKQAASEGYAIGFNSHRQIEFESLRRYAPFEEIIHPKR